MASWQRREEPELEIDEMLQGDDRDGEDFVFEVFVLDTTGMPSRA